MASCGLRSSLLVACVAFLFSGQFPVRAFAQESGGKTTDSSHQEDDGDRLYRRDELNWNWNQRGRTVPGPDSAAVLRLRAYRQKMAMRAPRTSAAATLPPKRSLDGTPATVPLASGSTAWVPLGPVPLASDATGDGMQNYNWVSGRATSVLIDPADSTGNTVLLGGAYGGLWKSTNAGSQNSSPASVTWQALIDDQPTLAVGAIALQPGNSKVILVGTGETNSSGDSYYGLGILLSTNAGASWTQITGIGQAPNVGQSFIGIGFSKIVFSTAQPNVVVAATAGDNGLCLGEEAAAGGGNSPCLGPEEDGNSTVRGLYYSQNSGVTWNRAILTDGSVPASATAVIYNPLQGTNGTFYAFIRRHGLYSSTDGQHFTRLASQPTAGLASANCPAGSNASTCLIYRGEFAVVPGRNEMYVWVVDVQPDANGNPVPTDKGIWQSLNGGIGNGGTGWTQIPDNGITNCGDNAFGPNSGCGVEQGWYNLELAAIPDAAETDIYAGAINLYKCTLTGGTTCAQGDWINLTHVYGCNPGPLGAPAHVHPNQHGIAFMVVGDTSPGYFAHDGGISRTLDGYSGLNTGNCTGTNQFDSLSQTLGSMTEFVSVSAHPTDADILLGGAGGNGSPKTSTATSSGWQNALGGDGGFTAINPTDPNQWFAENPFVTILECDSVTGTGSDCNDNTFIQVVGPSNLGGDQGAFYTPYILDPQNAREMLVGTCRAWQINTNGANPLQLSNDFDTLGTGVCTGDEINLVNALAAGGPIVNGSSAVVYAVTNGYGPLSGYPGGEVWVTTSAGTTLMTNVTQNPTQNVNPNGYAISTVAMDSSDSTGNTAYVGIMGFSTPGFPTSHLWKTTNAGTLWTDWTGTGATELPDAPVNALLVDSQVGQVYVGTDVGVFVTSTTTPSWTEVGPMPGPGVSGFLPNVPVTALQLFNPDAVTKTLVASTYGRGIWNYPLVAGPDFAIAVTATPNTTVVNQNVTWSGTLTALNAYSGSVTLTCTAVAPGTCRISPATVTPTASGAAFTVTVGSSTTGTFNFTIQGTDRTLTHSTQPETLTVETALPPDFAIVVTATPNTTAVNQTVTWNGTLTALNGYGGSVSLTCTGAVPGTCGIVPSTIAPSAAGAAFAVTLGNATAGTFNFAIQGTDGTLTHATPTVTLTVTPMAQGFTWTDTGSPTASVLAGQSASYIFSAVPADGSFSSAVSFACSNLPVLTSGAPGAGCDFNPTAIAAGAPTTGVTLTVWTCGPNLPTLCPSGTGSDVRPSTGTSRTRGSARPDALPFFTLAWVLAGIVGMGQKKRGKPRLYRTITGICLGLGLMALLSCGAVGGSSSTTPPPVTVTVNPGLATLFASEAGNSWPPGATQQQFAATVNGSTSQSVTWAVMNGSANGTVDGTGLYTAPAVVPNPATVTVTATSAAAANPGSTFVTVATPTALGTSQITVTATAGGGAAQGDAVTLTVQ
jgi:hypothetical protein